MTSNSTVATTAADEKFCSSCMQKRPLFWFQPRNPRISRPLTTCEKCRILSPTQSECNVSNNHSEGRAVACKQRRRQAEIAEAEEPAPIPKDPNLTPPYELAAKYSNPSFTQPSQDPSHVSERSPSDTPVSNTGEKRSSSRKPAPNAQETRDHPTQENDGVHVERAATSLLAQLADLEDDNNDGPPHRS